MKRTFISISALALAFACMASDFTPIVERIVNSNPAIVAARSRIAADSVAAMAENNLPDPELEGEVLFGKEDNKYNAGISQAFDWPGLYSARRRQAQLSQMAAEALIDVDREESSVKVATLLSQIAAANCRIRVCNGVLDVLNRLTEIYRNALSQGNVTVIDYNKLLIEAADYSQTLADARQSASDACDALRAIAPQLDIDRMVSDLDDFPMLQLYTLDEYQTGAGQNSASVKALDARMLADKGNARVASMSGRPGFSLGYRYANEDSKSYNGFSVGMTLPLFSNRHRSAAAAAAIDATLTERDALLAATSAEIAGIYRRAKSTGDRIATYGKAVTSTNNLELLRRSFDAGQITLTDYIYDTRYFIEAELRLIDLRQAYTDDLLTLYYRCLYTGTR